MIPSVIKNPMPTFARPTSLHVAGVAAAAALLAIWRLRSRRRVDGPWLLRRCTVLASTVSSCPIPENEDRYEEVDVRLDCNGCIKAVAPAGKMRAGLFEACIDGRRKLLLPGFVNAHTHSTEMLSRGLIPPVPLDLWVLRLLSTIGEAIGIIGNAYDALHLAALHCGVESLLGGCTSVLDHCWVNSADEAEAVTSAYRQIGIRAFFAPMLNDDARAYENYIPVAHDAAARNACAGACGLAPDGKHRTESSPSDPEACARAVALWEEIIARLHRPSEGVEVIVGPVTAYSCSMAMLRAAADIRRQHSLHGHIHLLESRAQKMEACRMVDRFPNGSAVQMLDAAGFLRVEGTVTSCAHTCWLEGDDMRMMAEAGAAVVHNPLSNLRLGSGVCQVRRCLQAGVDVALGCDGACSSDGQDMTEAIKAACLVSTLATPEYNEWLTARETLRLAYEGGAAAVGLRERAGKILPGRLADLTLWDLTSLSMLPQGDPASLLVLGRPQAGPPTAGGALHSVFVAGRRLVSRGECLTIDVRKLRAQLWDALPRRTPGGEVAEHLSPSADYHRCAECEYRAALNLDGNAKAPPATVRARTAATLRWDPLTPTTKGKAGKKSRVGTLRASIEQEEQPSC